MSKPDLPQTDDGSNGNCKDDGDESHPLEVGLDAAEEHDTAGIEEILEDIE